MHEDLGSVSSIVRNTHTHTQPNQESPDKGMSLRRSGQQVDMDSTQKSLISSDRSWDTAPRTDTKQRAPILGLLT